MLSKGLERVIHNLFQTKSYQLPSRGESVFTKAGGLNQRDDDEQQQHFEVLPATTTSARTFNANDTDNERQATLLDDAVRSAGKGWVRWLETECQEHHRSCKKQCQTSSFSVVVV